jgi:hypothetical protein
MSEIIRDKIVITRKPHKCWGCTKDIEIGTKIQCVTCKDGKHIITCYWCDVCKEYMDKHCDFWDLEAGFGYGELRECEDYPEEENRKGHE